VLDAKRAVDLHMAVIIGPSHAELNGTLGFNEALQQAHAGVLRMALQKWPEASRHFVDGLQKLGLVGVAALDIGKEIVSEWERH
jgi:hypothetical protein